MNLLLFAQMSCSIIMYKDHGMHKSIIFFSPSSLCLCVSVVSLLKGYKRIRFG